MPQSLQCAQVRSLRWRLLRTVCIAALLGLALSGALSYQQAQHEAEELMDGHLAQSARLLLALVRDNESHLADLAVLDFDRDLVRAGQGQHAAGTFLDGAVHLLGHDLERVAPGDVVELE